MSESRQPMGVDVAGRYALLNRLGVGGMGEVWQAHDTLTSQAVAVKVLKPSIAGAPAAELRFQREIRAMARLNHPRVVPVIDAGADPKVGLFFVMQLQQGRALHEVAPAFTSWRQLAPVVDQILETLAHAHAHGVIHRDIKPDNILVDADGEAVLLDFGVARLKDQARSGTSAYDMLGTVDYAAPEQATGNRRRIGPWTDLYCFGIVLYELVCGRLPFWAASPVQSLMIRLDHGCPRLEPRPGFATPQGLWALLDRLMRPEPLDRIRHAADARNEFAKLLDGPYETITPGLPRAITPAPVERSALTDSDAEKLLQHRQARYAQGSDGSLVSRPLEAPLRTATLVGRDELLLQLSRGLERWRHQPKPGVLLLAGPEGCGKSRLSEELVTPFLAAGQVDGHRHQWHEGTTPREVALSIAGAIGMPADAAEEHLHWWLRGSGLTEEADRHRLVAWALSLDGTVPGSGLDLRRFADFLQASVNPTRPYLLVLDGLMRVELPALALIDAVRGYRLPVIVVVTVRVALPPDGVAPPSWVPHATRTLGPLDDAALGRIVDELLEPDGLDLAALIHAAAGSPARLLDAIRMRQRYGEIIPAWPRWRRAPDDWDVPDDSMQSLITFE